MSSERVLGQGGDSGAVPPVDAAPGGRSSPLDPLGSSLRARTRPDRSCGFY